MVEITKLCLQCSNDICESILGLNDYLHVAIPNTSQDSRSNLVEVKKNKTIKWLDTLPEEKQDKVRWVAVAKECKEENEKQSERRRKKILEDHKKKVALLERQVVSLAPYYFVRGIILVYWTNRKRKLFFQHEESEAVCIATRADKHQKNGIGSTHTHCFLSSLNSVL